MLGKQAKPHSKYIPPRSVPAPVLHFRKPMPRVAEDEAEESESIESVPPLAAITDKRNKGVVTDPTLDDIGELGRPVEPNRQSKWYFVTAMNLVVWAKDRLVKTCDEDDRLIFYHGCEEVAPTTGTKHIHLIVKFSQPCRWTKVQKMFHGCNVRAGRNWMNAINYVNKNNNVTFTKPGCEEMVGPQRPGKRTDIAEAVGTCGNSGLEAVMADHPTTFVKFPGGFKALANHYSMSLPKIEPQVIWCYGATGFGKSLFVRQCCDIFHLTLWNSNGNLQWFDGYDPMVQDAVLFDDVRPDNFPFAGMLVYLDRYRVQAPVKGGFVNFNPKYIFCTSPVHPMELYENNYGNRAENPLQLGRRIDQCLCFFEKFKYRAVSPNFAHPEDKFDFTHLKVRVVKKPKLDVKKKTFLEMIDEMDADDSQMNEFNDGDEGLSNAEIDALAAADADMLPRSMISASRNFNLGPLAKDVPRNSSDGNLDVDVGYLDSLVSAAYADDHRPGWQANGVLDYIWIENLPWKEQMKFLNDLPLKYQVKFADWQDQKENPDEHRKWVAEEGGNVSE